MPLIGFTTHYINNNLNGHSSWKEIVITRGDGVSLVSSSAPSTDRSARLSNYPTDLLNRPPQDLEASAAFSAPALAPLAALKPIESPAIPRAAVHSRRTELVSTEKAGGASRPEIGARNRHNTEDRNPLPGSAIQLQANKQMTPRSKFTELVSARNLS